MYSGKSCFFFLHECRKNSTPYVAFCKIILKTRERERTRGRERERECHCHCHCHWARQNRAPKINKGEKRHWFREQNLAEAFAQSPGSREDSGRLYLERARWYRRSRFSLCVDRMRLSRILFASPQVH